MLASGRPLGDPVTKLLRLVPILAEDLDGNGSVGPADLAILLSAWGTKGGLADLNGDGFVGAPDLAQLLAAWN
jgi:hypothetical protein